MKQLNPSKDPEVRLNLFSLLSNVLSRYGENDEKTGGHREKIHGFVNTIVEGMPNFCY